MKKVRLIDIANETGFSIKTISRVVNQQGGVHPETRKKIMEVVKKYNYSPNPMAVTLRTNRTNTIGFVVPDFTNQFFGEVGLAIESYCKAQNYSLIVSFSGNTEKGEEEALRLLTSKYVDGVVLASVGTTDETVKEILTDDATPLVVIDNELQEIKTNAVIHDNVQGAFILTQHLIDHRYTNIGCIAGLLHQTSGSERLQGFKMAMEENHLEVPETHIISEDWTSDGGYRAMKRLLELDLGVRPRALFVANSVMALGCYKALIQESIKVPEEIAIVSFDNLSYIESLEPPITTLSSTGQLVGEEAAKLLFTSMQDNDVTSTQRVTIQGKIIKRRSCGCA
jgi:LacI family transcriptional regulator